MARIGWAYSDNPPIEDPDATVEPLFINPSSIRNAAIDEASALAESWADTERMIAREKGGDDALEHELIADFGDDIAKSILSLKSPTNPNE